MISSYLRRNSYEILCFAWKKFFVLASILSFLWFFINLLAVLRYNTENLSDQVQSQLGMYFYMKETVSGSVDTSFANFKEDIQQAGMDLALVTKDQALLTLQQRLPDIAKSFEAYGIKNPLPTTIYVRFDDQQEYERLQTIVQRYHNVLEQGESIDSQQSFSQQQYRITQTINLIAMVRMMMLVLMVALGVIMLAFLYFAMRVVYLQFQKQLEIEKLLGMSYGAIIFPFLCITAAVLVFACILVIIYSVIFGSLLNNYMLTLFYQSIFESVVPSLETVWGFQMISCVCLLFVGLTTLFLSFYRKIAKM